MDSHPASESTNQQLPADALSRVTWEAKKEGIFAGLTSGLASGEHWFPIIGARLMGFNRNKTLLCGILSGVLAGYYFTQALTSTAIAQLQAEESRLASGTLKPGTERPQMS
ncbi:hypothetical protein L208DRAFT_1269368 [Tricholoma matsutake]|nr:hypothetical protein L208DRAFT_1269368 [Tricholoma matsutake 945]